MGYAVYSLKPQSVELPPPPSPFLLQACTQMGLPEGAGSRSDGSTVFFVRSATGTSPQLNSFTIEEICAAMIAPYYFSEFLH